MVFNIRESEQRTVIKEFPREVKIMEHVWIPMSDGAKLAATIWLPVDAVEHPVPAIMEYIPYRKNDFTKIRDSARHPYFAGHGYASIRVDIRGSGDSDGLLEDEYTKREQDDALEIIDWIAEQKWATGAVGMFGKSWGGFNSLQVAAREHPNLKSIITLCSTDDRYADDVHYRGGNVLASDMLWWSSTMFAYNARPQDPEVVGESWRENWMNRLENTPPLIEYWMEHQFRNDYWKHGSICEDYSKVNIPVFAVGGWEDGYTNAVFRLVENLPNKHSKGLIGPWAHEYPEVATPEPSIGFLQESLRWWDQWLKGIDTGVKEDPKLISYIQDNELPQVSYDARPGRWVADYNWPSNDITTEKLYLDNNTLTSKIPAEEKTIVPSVQQHGLYSGVFCPFGEPGDLASDQRVENDYTVVYTSTPFEENKEILGHPVFHAEVSADQKNALIAVRLCIKAPTGESTLISAGMLNLTHYQSHEHPEPLEIGRKYQVAIKLDAIGQQLPKDHRLEVAISPTYWPQAWPSPKEVTLTVYEGEKTTLELPIRTPQAHDDRVLFPLPEIAEVIPTETIRVENRTRNITHNLIDSTWKLEDFSDEGERLLPCNGINYGSKNKNMYTIKEHDPLSATSRCEWELTLGRGEEWQTKLLTYSEMTCDETMFYLLNTLEAYENDEKVFEKTWKKEIPRQLV